MKLWVLCSAPLMMSDSCFMIARSVEECLISTIHMLVKYAQEGRGEDPACLVAE